MQKDAFLLQDLLCKWIQYSVATYMGPSNAEIPMEVTGARIPVSIPFANLYRCSPR